MQAEPEVVTKASSELENAANAAQQAPGIHWSELSPKEKTKFLFEQVKKIEEIQ